MSVSVSTLFLKSDVLYLRHHRKKGVKMFNSRISPRSIAQITG